uniref:Uncharacterized protein n=1 Tax=Amphimedon queenslandica TaxID=400682 RepID=A0A1X7VJX4_AMPQE
LTLDSSLLIVSFSNASLFSSWCLSSSRSSSSWRPSSDFSSIVSLRVIWSLSKSKLAPPSGWSSSVRPSDLRVSKLLMSCSEREPSSERFDAE